MNALFYITVLRKRGEKWLAFVVTTPDGPHDRHAAVIDFFTKEFHREYGRPAPRKQDPQGAGILHIHAEFVCLTPDDVWKEV